MSGTPVIVVGAGPIGLAAAVALLDRGLDPLILERGPGPGTSIGDWGHVRLFTPWSLCLFAPAVARLEAVGWRAPVMDEVPTGADLVDAYLRPLCGIPEIRNRLRFNSEVSDIKLGSGESSHRFEVSLAGGAASALRASAVIDASGTWRRPNGLGPRGAPVAGEVENRHRFRYGIPDAQGAERARYAGRRVAVVGGGHSAMNAVLALADLTGGGPAAHVIWVRRNPPTADAPRRDAIAGRAALEAMAAAAVAAGRVIAVDDFATSAVTDGGAGLSLCGVDGRRVGPLDEVIVATGQSPDLAMLRHLLLALDPEWECPTALAPLIDPRRHTCRSVAIHGAAQLTHPDAPGFYIAGMKSYGRAPTFLLATGYAQVASIVESLPRPGAAVAA